MYWSYVLTAGGVLGIYLAGKKNRWGWALGLFMQWLWVIYAFQTEQYGFILSAIAYGAVYARNFYLWHRDKKVADESPHNALKAGDYQHLNKTSKPVPIHTERWLIDGKEHLANPTISPEEFKKLFPTDKDEK